MRGSPAKDSLPHDSRRASLSTIADSVVGTPRNSAPSRIGFPEAAEGSNPVSQPEFDEACGGHRKKSDVSQTQLSFVAEVFLELSKLLEQYAPTWYTDEQHKRVVAALRVLQDPQQVAKELARSQKAG